MKYYINFIYMNKYSFNSSDDCKKSIQLINKNKTFNTIFKFASNKKS